MPSGAWCVHQHPVEDPFPGEVLSPGLGHHTTDRPHAVDVGHQGPETLGVHVVCHQGPLVFHERGDLGGFPPGGGTEVEDPLAGLWVQGQGRKGLGCFLHVIEPEPVFQRGPDGCFPLHPEEEGIPPQGLQHKPLGLEACPKLIGRGLYGVGANHGGKRGVDRLPELLPIGDDALIPLHISLCTQKSPKRTNGRFDSKLTARARASY